MRGGAGRGAEKWPILHALTVIKHWTKGGDALTTDRSRNDPIEYTLGLEEGAWDGCPGDVVVGVVVGGASVVGVDVEVVGEVGVVVVLLAVVVVVATVVVLVVLELFVAFYNLSNIY